MPQVVFSDERTVAYGTEDCHRMRRHIFTELYPITGDLAVRYVKTAERESFEQANFELQDIYHQLRIADLNLCADSEELFKMAIRLANKCDTARQRTLSPINAYETCSRIVGFYQIKAPCIKDDNPEPALNRMCSPGWWNRRIHILRLRKIETIARNIELVNRLRGTYASDYTVHVKRKQKERNREYLATNFVSNQNGEIFSLQNLADRSVSNPVVRRTELMTRIRGFEMVAEHLGHVGEFYTLTTPSRMHACLHTGRANPNHDGTTVLQAHEYLVHLWALIRAELDRQNIHPYGFRVVEPHHDGTPHWHLLLFIPEMHREATRAIMRHYALMDSGNEPGALKRRFEAVPIDPAKGSATGYIAKYISKNIDGYKLEQDLYGNPAASAAERITAWANTWGIRQFQQIGGPSVTVWRQLRKLDKTEDPELETIRKSATASDWAAFMLAMGDPETSHRSHCIRPFYDESKRLNPLTGEIYSPATSRYGDAVPLRATGIVWKGKNYSTRKHVWMLLKVDSEDVTLRSEAQAERTSCHDAAVSLGLVSITVPPPFYDQKIIHEKPTQH
ncbi:replication endonuclease [Nitrosomonas sp. PY1]|uniref:replication endonuclease n=1 Tax=Nitrosomonas sp. PY1 TaxID=1803906 RepID=UPI001FC7D609|nr:replication endonuclease [Nitrosomonas sp. PY1]